MTSELDVLQALTEAIGKLNELDDIRAAELAALRDDVRALSNRIEALTRATSHVHSLPYAQHATGPATGP